MQYLARCFDYQSTCFCINNYLNTTTIIERLIAKHMHFLTQLYLTTTSDIYTAKPRKILYLFCNLLCNDCTFYSVVIK